MALLHSIVNSPPLHYSPGVTQVSSLQTHTQHIESQPAEINQSPLVIKISYGIAGYLHGVPVLTTFNKSEMFLIQSPLC